MTHPLRLHCTDLFTLKNRPSPPSRPKFPLPPPSRPRLSVFPSPPPPLPSYLPRPHSYNFSPPPSMDGLPNKPPIRDPDDYSTPQLLLHENAEPTSRPSLAQSCNGSRFSFKYLNRQEGREEDVVSLLSWTEIKKQCHVAGPMIYVNLLQFSLQVIPLMFVGHLGELALSAASIATTFAEATGSCFLLGMGSGLETLCGQAYGAKQYHLLGLFMQRAVIVLNLTSIPLAIAWAYMGRILLACGQDPAISMKAGEYARWLIPTLFAYASSQPLIKFLQTQSVMFPMVICSSITVLLHFPISWMLVYKSGLNHRGAALATSVSNWMYVLLLSAFVSFSKKCEKTRSPFSWEVLQDMNSFFKLAIPSAVMLCLEYWSFDMIVFLSGLLPNPQLETSTLSICLSTSALVYMIPFGLSAAASTRVSNELGAGHALAARASVCVALCLTLVEASMVSTIFYSIRNVLGKAYSNEPEVTHYVATMMPLVALTSFMDSVQSVLSGVARGCGWQKFGAYVNLAAYYLVGLPAAIIMCFIFKLHGKGLWMGITSGLLVQTFLLLSLTILTNWDRQAKDARKRVTSSLKAILLA